MQIGPLAVDVTFGDGAKGALSGTAYRPVEAEGVAPTVEAGAVPRAAPRLGDATEIDRLAYSSDASRKKSTASTPAAEGGLSRASAVSGKPPKRFQPGTEAANTNDKTAYYDAVPSLTRRLSEWARAHKLLAAGFAGFALLMPSVLLVGGQLDKPRAPAQAPAARLATPTPSADLSAPADPLAKPTNPVAPVAQLHCPPRGDQPAVSLRNAITAYADGNFAKAKELYECLARQEPTDSVSREILLRINEHLQGDR